MRDIPIQVSHSPVCTAGMQDLEHSLPGPFVNVVFAMSNLGRWDNVTLQDRTVPLIKAVDSPCSMLLSSNSLLYRIYLHHIVLLPWDLRAKRIEANMLMQWIIKPFVSDLGVSCFLSDPWNSNSLYIKIKSQIQQFAS